MSSSVSAAARLEADQLDGCARISLKTKGTGITIRTAVSIRLPLQGGRKTIASLLRSIDEELQLPQGLELHLRDGVQKLTEGKKIPYITSWERMAQERGIAIGKEIGEKGSEKKGKLALVLRLLKQQVGIIDDRLRAQIEDLSSARLEQLALASLNFSEPADLERWLKRRARYRGSQIED